ncbi:DUF6714 family protein [Rhizobium sp. ERR 922]|uniref:DUF6714 family protein n=1 Tax=unclassified Rhizobium TaxID=2613769 RepID=UPI0032B21763
MTERTIERAPPLIKPVSDLPKKVRAAIRDAFAGATLDKGPGKMQALDDYASNEVRAACRADDEKGGWTAIAPEILNKHSSSPSFFDAKGMRCHLPAYQEAYSLPHAPGRSP